jgi:hypothetical protein
VDTGLSRNALPGRFSTSGALLLDELKDDLAGLDTFDHALDIVVMADRRWRLPQHGFTGRGCGA